MKAIVPPADATATDPSGVESAPPVPPIIRPARQGCQPVHDLAAFLESLPDFGQDAASLLDAITEDRAVRRAALETGEC